MAGCSCPPYWLRNNGSIGLLPAKRFNALGADASAVAEFRRHLRQQPGGNVQALAPTWPLGCGIATPALIGLVAERTPVRFTGGLNIPWFHGLVALTR